MAMVMAMAMAMVMGGEIQSLLHTEIHQCLFVPPATVAFAYTCIAVISRVLVMV